MGPGMTANSHEGVCSVRTGIHGSGESIGSRQDLEIREFLNALPDGFLSHVVSKSDM